MEDTMILRESIRYCGEPVINIDGMLEVGDTKEPISQQQKEHQFTRLLMEQLLNQEMQLVGEIMSR